MNRPPSRRGPSLVHTFQVAAHGIERVSIDWPSVVLPATGKHGWPDSVR